MQFDHPKNSYQANRPKDKKDKKGNNSLKRHELSTDYQIRIQHLAIHRWWSSRNRMMQEKITSKLLNIHQAYKRLSFILI